MTGQPVGTCPGCRLTVAEACAAAVAPALCGLCALLPPDVLRRYAERWRPAEALALAGDAGGAA
jgi:hypothetical protein